MIVDFHGVAGRRTRGQQISRFDRSIRRGASTPHSAGKCHRVVTVSEFRVFGFHDHTGFETFGPTDDTRHLAVVSLGGELELAGLKSTGRKYIPPEELPDIFTLYEENIGMLTPMVAEELREAEKLYPEEWIRDSVKEAVLNNKRNIKYILKILENWAAKGKGVGTYQRHTKKADPDKYVKGRYGHMVRR